MRENPCYNIKTKQSCSKRCCGCAQTCKEWAEYVSERDKDYSRKKKIDVTEAYEISRNKKIKKYMKRYGKGKK